MNTLRVGRFIGKLKAPFMGAFFTKITFQGIDITLNKEYN